MRINLVAAARRRGISIGSVCAWTLSLVGHALLIAQLLRTTDIVPSLHERAALSVDVYLPEEIPPRPPMLPAPIPAVLTQPSPPANPRTPPTQSLPVARAAATPASAVVAADPEVQPNAVSMARRFEEQRVAIAADIAREHAPKRRFLQGRSIDGMLPDASNGKLPGFHPKTNTDGSDIARRLGQLLARGVPTAAIDPDAPSDLLTEGWEAASHGSDLADCERKYAQFEQDLRLQLCGEVRPPE